MKSLIKGTQMNLVQEVEEKITQMSRSERAELIDWIENFEADEWDKQIESDILAGKLDDLGAQALKDLELGNVRPI